MNVSGAIFAITAIALYLVDLSNASLLWMCDQSWNVTDYYEDNCINVALYGQVRMLLRFNWETQSDSSGRSIQSLNLNTIHRT